MGMREEEDEAEGLEKLRVFWFFMVSRIRFLVDCISLVLLFKPRWVSTFFCSAAVNIPPSALGLPASRPCSVSEEGDRTRPRARRVDRSFMSAVRGGKRDRGGSG